MLIGKLVEEYPDAEEFQGMEWTPRTPDVKLIEHFWDAADKRIAACHLFLETFRF